MLPEQSKLTHCSVLEIIAKSGIAPLLYTPLQWNAHHVISCFD